MVTTGKTLSIVRGEYHEIRKVHMDPAKTGDTVRVHYRGELTDGTVFDSSADREPLEFTLGSGQVIPGFDSAVTGMSPGEKKTVKIAADDAYGQRYEEQLLTLKRDQLPPGVDVEVGQALELTDDQGRTWAVTVAEVTPETITLDANHELAGKDLTFHLELVSIL